MAATPSPCSRSYLSQLFSGNAIVCSTTFKNYLVSDEQASVQKVVDNAQTYYGTDSAAAQVAEATATQQEAQAPGDVTNTTDSVAASMAGQFFTTCNNGDSGIALPGLGCVSWKYLSYGAIALVVLYFLALVSSFVPRPR